MSHREDAWLATADCSGMSLKVPCVALERKEKLAQLGLVGGDVIGSVPWTVTVRTWSCLFLSVFSSQP